MNHTKKLFHFRRGDENEDLSEKVANEVNKVGAEKVGEIPYEEFKRLDIRVAKVVNAVRVPNSARLLKLSLDISGETKQCIAGIGAKYDPELLKDKMIAVVTNLKPRQIMGLTSEVMLLAAASGPELSVLTLDRDLPSGAKVT